MPKRQTKPVQNEDKNKKIEEKKDSQKIVVKEGKESNKVTKDDVNKEKVSSSKDMKKDTKGKKIEVEEVVKRQQKIQKQEKEQKQTVKDTDSQDEIKKKKKKRLDKSKDRQEPKAIINGMEVGRKKADQDLIKDTGLLQAYQMLLRSICKYGLPTGDIYQFAAQQIQKYQRKKRAKELKIKAEMEIRKVALKKSEA